MHGFSRGSLPASRGLSLDVLPHAPLEEPRLLPACAGKERFSCGPPTYRGGEAPTPALGGSGTLPNGGAALHIACYLLVNFAFIFAKAVGTT